MKRTNLAELIIDNFAGGGGTSKGIEMALNRSPDIAVNHDREAIAMHKANHPDTLHLCEDVNDVDPVKVCKGRPVGLAWFSPDCTFHSKARGGKPFRDRNRARRRRGLAWIVIKWAKLKAPRVIILENVEEFGDWGPLLEDGTPCPERKGLTFRRWWKQLENLGYAIEMRQLRACDYGAPTIRNRLFIIARRDGQPIVWPAPTHGDPESAAVKSGRLLPWRTAAECIDFSLPCPSIFLTPEEAKKLGVRRPLAENTMRRIAKGVDRYVIDNPQPFIVHTAHGSEGPNSKRWGKGERSLHAPLPTQACTNDLALVESTLAPFITEHANASNQRNMPADAPLRTQCAEVKGGHFALVTPHITKFRTGSTGHGVDEPLHTITAGPKENPAGAPHAMGLVSALLAKHYGGFYDGAGADIDKPAHTITACDHHALVTSNLLKLKGTCQDGQPTDAPMPTIQAMGNHVGEVRALLLKFYGTDQDPRLEQPLHTVTTKDRFGLVMVYGELYQIVDIGMRMLQPPELFLAQGFPADYIIDLTVNGRRLSKSAQVRMCGNSVSPVLAQALVAANCGELAQEVAA